MLSGLVRAVKSRRKVRLGWLTPLLGIFVLLQITSFWTAAWNLRDLIPATDLALLLGLAFSGTYYFAASLVFPEETSEWRDLDQWYFQNKQTALTLVLLADAVQSAFEHRLRQETYDAASIVAVAATGLLVVAAVMTKHKRSNYYSSLFSCYGVFYSIVGKGA